MRRVSDLLPRVVRTTPDREHLLAAVVLDAAASALRSALPAPLARRVRPVSFREGTLTVSADGSVVASEVRLLRQRMLQLTGRTLKRRGFTTTVNELRVRVA